MDIKVCVQRYNGWEFRTVSVDLEEAVKKELLDQCEHVGGTDIEKDGFTIDSIVAGSIGHTLE